MTRMLRTAGPRPALKVVESQPILLSRLSPPQLRPEKLVFRTELMRKLDRILETRLTLVLAPAGYGKTTALGAWAAERRAEGLPVAWLTADETNSDPVQLLRHLMEAARFGSAGNGPEVVAERQFGSDVDAEYVLLLNRIDETGRDFVFILDDVHVLKDPAVTRLLDLVIRGASRHLHLVLCSRTRPGIKLGRIFALGEAFEIDAHDLQFSLEEARTLFQRFGTDVPGEPVLAQLMEKTEGWAAGLKLAAMAMEKGLGDSSLQRLLAKGDRSIQAFFRDEVLSRLPESVTEFAMQTSILGELTPDLCDAVTGRSDAAEVLSELESQQLFVQALAEPGWFRYHQLFADLLDSLLRQRFATLVPELHRRAADWYRSRHLMLQAVQHAFASEDVESAAALLDEAAPALLQSGQGPALLRYFAELPPEVAIEYPNLQLERIYASTLAWEFDDARRALRELRGALTDERKARWTERGVNIAALLRKLVHGEMNLAILMDEVGKASSLADQWFELPGGCSPFEEAVARTSRIYCDRELMELRTVTGAPVIRDIFTDNGERWGRVWHDCIVGATHVAAGDLGRAEQIYREAFDTGCEVAGRLSPLTAMPALHLAELLYERDSIEDASVLTSAYLPLAGRTGMVDQLVAGYVTHARILAQQSLSAALRTLDEAEEAAIGRRFERLRAYALAERIRLLVMAGELADARQVAIVNGLSTSLPGLQPARGATSRDVVTAFAVAQIGLVNGDLGAVEQHLRRWLRFLEDHRCVRFALRFSTLLAHVQILDGNAKASHRTVRAALEQGLRGGFVRTFADASAPVRECLAQMNLSGPDHALIAYHQRIASSLRPGPTALSTQAQAAPSPVERLNDREGEILLMLATGMTNLQISDEVGLTIGTVKWYLQQIYMKLDVKRRSEAVYKARQLGLIS